LAPSIFNFFHIVILMVAAAIIFALELLFRKNCNRLLNYISSASGWALRGVFISYFIAHGVVLAMKIFHRQMGDPRYTFWGVFIALSFISIIILGLIGIIIAGKSEEKKLEESRKKEKESVPGRDS